MMIVPALSHEVGEDLDVEEVGPNDISLWRPKQITPLPSADCSL